MAGRQGEVTACVIVCDYKVPTYLSITFTFSNKMGISYERLTFVLHIEILDQRYNKKIRRDSRNHDKKICKE